MGGVIERLPRLRIAFAHGGGCFPGIFGRIQHGFDVRPDLCATANKNPPSKYLGKFYVDSLVHDFRTLLQITEFFGKEKIFLGSDYPFPLGEERPGNLIESSSLDDQTKNLLLRENALQFLGKIAYRIKSQ
jgi:aminocarboxymuconate-semialdehyde decarboxylase